MVRSVAMLDERGEGGGDGSNQHKKKEQSPSADGVSRVSAKRTAEMVRNYVMAKLRYTKYTYARTIKVYQQLIKVLIPGTFTT